MIISVIDLVRVWYLNDSIGARPFGGEFGGPFWGCGLDPDIVTHLIRVGTSRCLGGREAGVNFPHPMLHSTYV